jgi:hypothetical protein
MFFPGRYAIACAVICMMMAAGLIAWKSTRPGSASTDDDHDRNDTAD